MTCSLIKLSIDRKSVMRARSGTLYSRLIPVQSSILLSDVHFMNDDGNELLDTPSVESVSEIASAGAKAQRRSRLIRVIQAQTTRARSRRVIIFLVNRVSAASTRRCKTPAASERLERISILELRASRGISELCSHCRCEVELRQWNIETSPMYLDIYI